jgi:hypothetical protein
MCVARVFQAIHSVLFYFIFFKWSHLRSVATSFYFGFLIFDPIALACITCLAELSHAHLKHSLPPSVVLWGAAFQAHPLDAGGADRSRVSLPLDHAFPQEYSASHTYHLKLF